jgi:hypothetical protein
MRLGRPTDGLLDRSVQSFSASGFCQTVPLFPLIHGLKRFRIQIRIRGDIRPRKSTPRYAVSGKQP